MSHVIHHFKKLSLIKIRSSVKNYFALFPYNRTITHVLYPVWRRESTAINRKCGGLIIIANKNLPLGPKGIKKYTQKSRQTQKNANNS
jgi:hypothetical protein